jgi:DNA-binding NtrC family response regulator
MRLGQFDDALLTVYELERNASGLEDLDLSQRVIELRGQIEQGLLGGVGDVESHVQAISGIPGLFSRDRSIPHNLSSVLQAGVKRVGADCGFIAMERTDGRTRLEIAARSGLTENLAGQLARWFVSEQSVSDSPNPCLFSRLSCGSPLIEAVPALDGQVSSCVFMPISLHDRRYGLLFLGLTGGQRPNNGFDRPSLDFLATYMGFLALFLYEKGRATPPGEGAHIPSPLEGVDSFQNIITQNEKMLDVLCLIRKVAPSDLTVLLNGETGTGKGLLAYAIHALSQRKDHKFLAINCAAIPETLLESELFGHMRGSFTGAHSDKKGLLAEATGGTVFLDEIGKMPLSMQGKLLHFLDTKVVRPVGSTQEHRIDVRIVCASKADLQKLAKKGLFLEDLYFRLLDFPLIVPPLRERRDDIQLLVQHFVERFAQELNIETPDYRAPFMDSLMQHNWPGNIRELEKTINRAIVLAQGEGVLRPDHLPAEIMALTPQHDDTDEVLPLKETLASVECREIAQTLKLTQGNKSQAARLLQVSYPNLLKKIRMYGIRID